jgi:parvulin-like peptidyl-prolyl isomerase
MADTPKNPQPQGGRKQGPQTDRSKGQPAPATPMTRRRLARHEREVRNQRRVVIVTAIALGLALLTVVVGLSYEQLWVPSRPVARVGDATLSRSDYWAERRLAYAREIAQNFQLVALFGGNQQFTQQFANQSPNINRQIGAIRSSPVDDSVVGQWETLQLKEQGAARMGISVSQDAINQAMANDLGLIFIPPPAPPITATATLSGTALPITATATLSGTAAPEATAAVTATLAPTTTQIPTQEPTVTPGGPTATLPPTSTPQPTPQPAEAATQVGQIVDEIFRRYEIELANASEDPALTKDDFRAALNLQYREQVINTSVQESLVPDAGFEESSEPAKVSARQILIAVSPPEGATQEQIDALFNDEKARADALVVELRGGAGFADVAAASSEDPGSASAGGELGLFDKDGRADNGATYPPELAAAAFGLELNTVSDPIRTQFGWHIIEVSKREVPPRDEQLRDARTEALDTWLAEQRAAITSERFPAQTPTPAVDAETPTAVPTYLPGPPTQVPTVEPTAATTEPAGTAAPTTGTSTP